MPSRKSACVTAYSTGSCARVKGVSAWINSVPAMVWAAAPDGTMNLVTDQWLTYCGMTKEQLARDWPRLVLHPDDYERCMTQWAQALGERDPLRDRSPQPPP